MARTKRVKYYSPKRRAIYAKGDDINALEVFEAHDWICNICGKKIDRRLRCPNWGAATLDHIIPLSLGGQHVFSNVAPAHLRCNLNKGATMPTDATTLPSDGLVA